MDEKLHKLLLDARGLLVTQVDRGYGHRRMVERIDNYILANNPKRAINPNAHWIICKCGIVCEVEYNKVGEVDSSRHVYFSSGMVFCTECDRELMENDFNNPTGPTGDEQ